MSILKNLYLLNTVSKKPFSIICDYLPVKVKKETTFYLRDEAFRNNFSLDLIENVLKDEDLIDPNIEFYRKSKSRKIYKYTSMGNSVAVKSFSFQKSTTKKLFRHKLYSLDEALNLILARKKDLPVPDVLCFGQNKKGIFCYSNLVVTDHIDNSFHPNDVFWGREKCHLSFEEIMKRLEPLFLKLYFSACNHVDTHGHSFFIHNSDPVKDKIIDFQFAVFLKEPNLRVFACQVSHLIRRVSEYFEKGFIEEWVHSLFNKAENKDVNKLYKFYNDFMVQKELGCFERMCLI